MFFTKSLMLKRQDQEIFVYLAQPFLKRYFPVVDIFLLRKRVVFYQPQKQGENGQAIIF